MFGNIYSQVKTYNSQVDRFNHKVVFALTQMTAVSEDQPDDRLIGIENRAKKWYEIWNKRNMQCLDQSNYISLQDLLKADGFDTTLGKLNSLEIWEQYIKLISIKVDLVSNDSLFEIGCGSGAFLYPWYREGHPVGGIDYSESLICVAQKVMNGMNFRVSDAIDVNIDEKFDIVLSNGVFQYFKDYSYAQKVIERMIMKARKSVAILEIPDLAKKGESENARRAALPEGEYDKKYDGLDHLYYDKAWFTQFSNKFGCNIEIFDQSIKEYVNGKFRFNVVIKKPDFQDLSLSMTKTTAV
jgi:ubiquinone/menaquinone biosynthesis C-methylase UbiE